MLGLPCSHLPSPCFRSACNVLKPEHCQPCYKHPRAWFACPPLSMFDLACVNRQVRREMRKQNCRVALFSGSEYTHWDWYEGMHSLRYDDGGTVEAKVFNAADGRLGISVLVHGIKKDVPLSTFIDECHASICEKNWEAFASTSVAVMYDKHGYVDLTAEWNFHDSSAVQALFCQAWKISDCDVCIEPRDRRYRHIATTGDDDVRVYRRYRHIVPPSDD